MNRRTYLVALGASTITLAGCSSRQGSGVQPTDEPSQTDSTPPPTPSPSPSVDGATEAKDQALTAEEEYITEQLGNAPCVEEWGLTDYVGWGKGATVINQSADGVYVEVRHPFWYSTRNEEADVGTEAIYLVTGDEVQRRSGTKVSPC